VIKKPKLTIFC